MNIEDAAAIVYDRIHLDINKPHTSNFGRNTTETQSKGSQQHLVACLVCQTPTEPENLTRLKIYVADSENVDVCPPCHQTLTEVLRGMMRTNRAGRKQGFNLK